MSDSFKVILKRANSELSWGFRLQGGSDFSSPLSIQAVVKGSIADQCGLKAGDVVVQINDYIADELQHDEAKRQIVSAGDNVELVIQRGSIRIWKPNVTNIGNLKGNSSNANLLQDPADNYVQRTSLAADKQEPLKINFFNKAPRPFPGKSETGTKTSLPDFVNIQCNAPMDAYPTNSGLEDFNHQAQTLVERSDGAYRGPKQGNPKLNISGPAGIRSVKAPTKLDSHIREEEPSTMVCNVCSSLIIGVFVRVKGEPLHPDCYKCAKCGKNLKNQGFYTISGQMFCDTCA